MKKIILLISMLVALSYSQVIAQDFVSTDPQNKNVILEEFTGVKCPNCPQGHATAAQILEDNPGRVWVTAYHPYNSSYTEPYPGNPDFRRHHPDALYTTPYCGTSRFMPSAFINRREYSGEKIQSRGVWSNYTTQQLAETSPVNVGLGTSYNESTKQLDIILEIYYTADMTDENTINVLFTESGMVAQQSGGGTNYVHHHVFRETFTEQWGDVITEPTIEGSFIQKTYSFDNSAEEYDMTECEVIAFIVNSSNEEIISGIGCHVGDNTNTSPPIADFTFETEEIIGQTSIDFTDLSSNNPTSWDWTFEGGNPPTSDEQNPSDIIFTISGTYLFTLTATNDFGSDTYSQEVQVNILISDINEVNAKSINIYPNPGNGFVNIDLQNVKVDNISIYDLQGGLVFKDASVLSGKKTLNLEFLNEGLYFIYLTSGSKTIIKKLIIN